MQEALREAEIAFRLGEVPIGAVIEKDGQIIAGAQYDGDPEGSYRPRGDDGDSGCGPRSRRLAAHRLQPLCDGGALLYVRGSHGLGANRKSVYRRDGS